MELSLGDIQIKNLFGGLIIGVSTTVKCIKPNVLREKCLMLYSLLGELHRTGKKVELTSSRLTGQYEKAVAEVSETFNYFVSCLNERRTECLKELEQAYSDLSTFIIDI